MNAVPHHPPAGPATPAPKLPTVRPPTGALPRLVIGVDPAAPKERLVLQSMIRLLDGREGLDLAFSDRDADCNVYFVPSDRETRIGADCIRVRLMPQGVAVEPGPGFALTLPVRVSPLTLMLHTAADLLASRAAAPAPGVPSAGHATGTPTASDLRSSTSRPMPLAPASRPMPLAAATRDAGGGDAPPEPAPARVGGPGVDMSGVHGVFRQLTTGLLAHERRAVYVGRTGAAPLLLDFGAQRVHCRDPIAALLRDRFPVHEPRRATAEEVKAMREEPPIRLHDLLWTAALCLGLGGAPVPPLRGRYRLTRWFDSAALPHPGVPRLAALLSSESADIDEASRASGLDRSTVRWLLEAALALGIAVPVDALDLELEFDPGVGAPGPDAAPRDARSIVGRLRERLHRR